MGPWLSGQEPTLLPCSSPGWPIQGRLVKASSFSREARNSNFYMKLLYFKALATNSDLKKKNQHCASQPKAHGLWLSCSSLLLRGWMMIF